LSCIEDAICALLRVLDVAPDALLEVLGDKESELNAMPLLRPDERPCAIRRSLKRMAEAEDARGKAVKASPET
jgi:hypothetical protein